MRIIVAQTAFLGDVVLTTPVFAALKRHWPAADITAWVRPEAADLLREHPHVAATLADDKRGADRGLSGLLHVARRIHAGRFDLAVAVHKSFRTALLLAAARVPRRVGFRSAAGNWLYHRRVDRNPALHELERNLSIVDGLGLDSKYESSQPLLTVATAARRAVDCLLREADITNASSVVGLAPGSVWPTKRWTPDGFAAIAAEMRRRGYDVLLLGAPNEASIAQDVNRLAGGAAVNLVGRTDVATLVAAIARCRAVVCNDSAPMHIANALNVPVVAIFGPTHPKLGFAPRGDRAMVVERDLDCRPCGTHGHTQCPIGTHACMRELAPTAVLAALDRLLASPPERQHSLT